MDVSAISASAKQRFPNLSVDELDFIRSAANDKEIAAVTGTRLKIRAALVAWVCVDIAADDGVRARQLGIRNADLDGDIDLVGARIEARLWLRDCAVGVIKLSGARVRTVCLDGTTCKGIEAEGLEVLGSFLYRGTAEASAATRGRVGGRISLLGARVTGDVDFSGLQIDNPGQTALELSRATVDGSVFLRRRARKDHRDQPWFLMSCGSVYLRYCTIAGALDAGGAHLTDPQTPRFERQKPVSLHAGTCKVGDVYLNGMTVDGGVVLDSSSISGSVRCGGSTFAGHFSARAAQVRDSFVWANVGSSSSDAELDLTFATVGRLEYAVSSFPEPTILTGLGYRMLHKWLSADETLKGRTHGDVSDFLTVIRRGSKSRSTLYSTEPYEQLAKVLRASGQEPAARRVLIAKVDDAMRRRSAPVRWIACLFKYSIGYGYKPLRILFPLVVMLAVGAVVFGASDSGFQEANRSPPPFSGVAFSIDALLPFLDLGQEKGWVVKETSAPRGLAAYYWGHVVIGWLLSSFAVAGITRSVRS